MRKPKSHIRYLRSSLLAGAGMLALAANAIPALAADNITDSASDGGIESVIVTGTRFSGVTAADSAAPVTVISRDALSHVGQPNLIQALNQIIPAFSAEAYGGDLSNLTLTAKLRGLNPNDTLILINGERRHTTGSLHIAGGAYQGASTADLDLIPEAAIERIEVLQDGAAAQYGSDAIAGVVNIILKSTDSGGTASVTSGQYYAGDGDTVAASGNIGFAIEVDSVLPPFLVLRHLVRRKA